MVSLGLAVTYLFLAFVVMTVVVLCCLGSGCHVPLGKMMKGVCGNTAVCGDRCCRRKGNARGKDDASVAGCCAWIPWLLTCGMCCGTFTEDDAATPGRASAAAVAQPVMAQPKDAVGTEAVAVAVSIPLLSMT